MQRCPYCAEEIKDEAIICRFCRSDLRPQPPRQPAAPAPPSPPALAPKEVSAWDIWIVRVAAKGFVVVIGLVIVAAVLTTLIAPTPTKKPYVSPLEEKFPVSSLPREYPRVSASDIVAAYDANEIAADQQWKGVTVNIMDPVSDIGKDILGNPYLIFGRTLHGVQAVFPRDSANDLARLSKGRTVTVRCRISGKTLGNVVARDCSLQ